MYWHLSCCLVYFIVCVINNKLLSLVPTPKKKKQKIGRKAKCGGISQLKILRFFSFLPLTLFIAFFTSLFMFYVVPSLHIGSVAAFVVFIDFLYPLSTISSFIFVMRCLSFFIFTCFILFFFFGSHFCNELS